MLLGAYFWGYLLTSLPGGMLAEWIGGRTVVGVSMALSAILTALIPFSASISVWAVYGVRVATGILGVSDFERLLRHLDQDHMSFVIMSFRLCHFESIGCTISGIALYHLEMGTNSRTGQIHISTVGWNIRNCYCKWSNSKFVTFDKFLII